jgi:endonuclease III
VRPLRKRLQSSRSVRVRTIARILREWYGRPPHHNKYDPLDELIFILLSAKTSERSYLRTYSRLKTRFPDWFSVLDAPAGAVHEVIAEGGLSKKKEAQIRALLRALSEDSSRFNRKTLSTMDDERLERYLTGLPGIGLKSARCVMMYSLGRQVFPVDTHCRRVLSRIGVIRSRRLTDRVQNEIQGEIPSRLRYDLHVDLVAHGRAVCKSGTPLCDECRLKSHCDFYCLTERPGSLRAAVRVAA